MNTYAADPMEKRLVWCFFFRVAAFEKLPVRGGNVASTHCKQATSFVCFLFKRHHSPAVFSSPSPPSCPLSPPASSFPRTSSFPHLRRSLSRTVFLLRSLFYTHYRYHTATAGCIVSAQNLFSSFLLLPTPPITAYGPPSFILLFRV